MVTLTTEEEGVALAAGAWLGGQRSALLLQSSGVGDCFNMLGLTLSCRFPLLMIVTMRGEWDEFNPWMVPLGRALQDMLSGAWASRACASITPAKSRPPSTGRHPGVRGPQAVAVLLTQKLTGKRRLDS